MDRAPVHTRVHVRSHTYLGSIVGPMRIFLITIGLCGVTIAAEHLAPLTSSFGQPQHQRTSMTASITNPTAKAAIEALNAQDRKAWDALFAPDATFADDGNEGSLSNFTNGAFGKGRERFTRIDKVEHDGLHVYGQLHSDSWGDFKVYFKFHVADGYITRLEVGQSNH